MTAYTPDPDLDAQIAEAAQRHRAETRVLLEELDLDELSPAALAMLRHQLRLILGCVEARPR